MNVFTSPPSKKKAPTTNANIMARVDAIRTAQVTNQCFDSHYPIDLQRFTAPRRRRPDLPPESGSEFLVSNLFSPPLCVNLFAFSGISAAYNLLLLALAITDKLRATSEYFVRVQRFVMS